MMNVQFERIERVISADQKGIFTLVSLASALMIYVNLSYISSLYLGVAFSTIYFLINSIFAGNILFKDESPGFRFALGFFIVVVLIALGSSAVIVATALVPVQFNVVTTIGLLVVLGAVTSLLNNKRIMAKLHRQKG